MTASRTPQFDRIEEGQPLYSVADGEGDLGWCAYLLPGITGPDSITFDDSLKNKKMQGHYLFARVAPQFSASYTVEEFCHKILTEMPSNTRLCVWFVEPNAPTLESGLFFEFSQTSGEFHILASNFNNALTQNTLTFSLPKGLFFGINDQGIVIKELGSDQPEFATTPSGHAPTVDSPATVPFFGANRACFIISGEMNTELTIGFLEGGVRFGHGLPPRNKTQCFPVIEVAAPGVNVDYVASIDILDPVNALLTADQIAQGLLRTCFALKTTSLAGQMRTSSGRTANLVPQFDTDEYDAPVPFSGSLVLEGKTHGSRDRYLTFAGDFALEVHGAPLTKKGAGATHELLCGLFGTEVLSFRAYAEDVSFDLLRFVPRQPAFAPVFPFVTASLADPGSGKIGLRLDDSMLTSWATIVPGDGGAPMYLAQPQGSALYKAKGAIQHGSPPMLDFFPTMAPIPPFLSTHPPLQPDPPFSVPLAPYAGITAGVGFAAADLGTFESQILAPTRKALIGANTCQHHRAAREARAGDGPTPIASSNSSDASETAATPQGLLAQVVKGSVPTYYQKIILALSEPAPKRPPEMAFVEPDAELQSLFMTNQLFAVVTNPASLGKLVSDDSTIPAGQSAFQNTVTISDWTMAADVGSRSSATDYRNVVVFKFCDGSLSERIANPNKWVDTADFSLLADAGSSEVALTGLSQWLQTFVTKAKDEAASGNTLYGNFAAVVDDPHWHGILVLRAAVDPSDIPDSIRGLAAGIDLSQFEAHHFGVTVSRVKVGADGAVQADGPSSMFGLVDYVLPAYRTNLESGGNPNIPLPLPVTGNYGFTVLQLQVLFDNSAIADFRSHIQLTSNELFDSAVTQAYGVFGKSPSNAVVLKGAYQNQGTKSTYIFQQDAATLYGVDSNVFNSIAFDRVQFNTLSDGNADGIVRSRFLIWGTLDFVSLPSSNADSGPPEPFDVLSFGSTPGDNGISAPLGPSSTATGLTFSNLQVDLQSPLATPNVVTYAFDAGNLALDPATSTPRKGSLYETFALGVESFIVAPAGKTPADYGFLPVSMKVPLQALSGGWQGIVYKVTMGTAGALANEAGFESELLLAWSPQSKAGAKLYAVLNGIKLPGAAPGAKLLSLQGVLKLSVGSIQLIHSPFAGGTLPSFNLMLSNIGLKFLGIDKLPSGATINFFLFGDPTGEGSLGWYSAYIKDAEKKEIIPAPE